MNINNPSTFGVPGLTLTTSNAEGTGNAIRTGASVAVFDTSAPPVISITTTSSATGSAGVTARRDHNHGITIFSATAPTDISLDTTAASAGDNNYASREDHVHGTRPAYFWKSVL